jgi:hypothetical protein
MALEDNTMDEKSLERLLSRFIRAAEAHNLAVEGLDAAAANRQAVILTGLYASIRTHGTGGRDSLAQLLDHDSPAVAGMAAIYLLPSAPELALPVLERLAASPGLLGFRARAALDRWQSGEWELDD